MLGQDRLGGQTVLAFGLKIWSAVASFGLSLLIARTFGAAGSGHFGIAVTTITILSYAVLLGLDYTVVRVAAGDLREGRRDAARGAVATGARIVLVVAPLTVAALWLVHGWIATTVLRQASIGPLIGIMLWAVVPLALQRVASAALRANGRIFASQVIDGPLGTTVAVTGLVVAALTGHAASLEVPGLLYVGGVGIGAVVGWLGYRRVVAGWPPAAAIPVVPMIIAGLPIVALNLSNVFTEWYTTVSLGSYWPAAVVGQYRVAWQFVALAGLVQVAMDTILGPRIAAAARVGAKHEIAAMARKSILLVLLLASPLFVALAVAPGPLLRIFGPEFGAAATTLQILAVGQLIRMVSGPLGSILIMTGSQRWAMLYTAAGVVTCVVLVALLVPRYGAVGAAIATGASVLARNIAAAIIVHRVLGINLLRRPRAP